MPNVSLCAQENEVHYNPTLPPPIIDGHEYVDLGLPSGTLWAKDGKGPSGYYGYGKTVTYSDPYPTYNGTENPLSSSVDIVTIQWGSQWHIPTKEQFEELISNTTQTWQDGEMLFTAQNGNQLSLKADGGIYYCTEEEYGTAGYYGSSTPNGQNNFYYLYFTSNGAEVQSSTRGNCVANSICGVVG